MSAIHCRNCRLKLTKLFYKIIIYPFIKFFDPLAPTPDRPPRQPCQRCDHQVRQDGDQQDALSHLHPRLDPRGSQTHHGRVERRVHPLERPHLQLRDHPAGARLAGAGDGVVAQRPVDGHRRPRRLRQVLAVQHEQRQNVSGKDMLLNLFGAFSTYCLLPG